MFIKIAVHTIPAVQMTCIRLVVASMVMGVVMIFTHEKFPRSLKNWLLMAAVAIFGNALPFTLISWGEQTVDSALAAIMMAVMPMITLMLAHIFTDDEKLNRWKLVGVILGFAGLIVLMGPDKLLGLGSDVKRQLAIAGGAVSYAVSSMITRKIVGVGRIVLAFGILILSAIIITPVMVLSGEPIVWSPSTGSLLSAILLGVLQTALATLILLGIIKKLGVTFLSQLNFLVPLFGVAFSVVFLSERLQLNAVIALGVIMVGIGFTRKGLMTGR